MSESAGRPVPSWAVVVAACAVLVSGFGLGVGWMSPAPAAPAKGCAESADLINGSTLDRQTCPPGTRLEATPVRDTYTLFRCVCPASSAAAVDAGLEAARE